MFISVSNWGFNKQKKVEKLIDEAEIEMLHGNFSKALIILESAKSINKLNPDIYFLQIEIGEISRQTELLIEANQMLSVIYPDKNLYKLNLASLLFDTGEYKKTKELLATFKSNSSRYKRLNASCEFALQQLDENRDLNFQLIKLGKAVNTNADEYWPSYSCFDSTLYFTRLVNLNTHYNTERIYYVNENNCDECVEQLQMNKNPNVSEGNISISADGKLLFLTICGGASGKGSCDIYYSLKKDSVWANPQKVPKPVSTHFWESQPFLSYDGTKLFFVSNRDGGIGGMDIYQCDVKYIGSLIKFENVRNIGRPVNTENNEFSPYLSYDQTTFYFSSDGHVGMGGDDIYKAIYADNRFSDIRNLGFPINTHFNEGGYTAGLNSSRAFFYSNRSIDSLRSKDILKIIKPPYNALNVYLCGKLIDKNTKKCIGGNICFLVQKNDIKINSVTNESTGYRTVLPKSKNIGVSIIKAGYKPYYEKILFKESLKDEIQEINFMLEPLLIGKSFVIEDLLFEFDSSDLLPGASEQLSKLVEFLETNPSVKIEIIGHTDNLGDRKYNQDLSEMRAEKIYRYLGSKISDERISFSGKGSTEPVATNETEAGRAKNRRTEIKILDLNFSKDQ